MRIMSSKSSVLRASLAASVLLWAGASSAQSVNLTAAPANAALPDGQSVPMWGYSCDAAQPDQTGVANPAACRALSSSAGWSPVKITVPYVGPATSLTINLTNHLTFGSTNIPTSMVIVGQLGGGLGGAPTTTVSPPHAPKGVTWPASGPAIVSSCAPGGDPAGNGTHCPPAQPDRVQSFAAEVGAGATIPLTWNNLKPGTYLIESGTHPSIQGSMGLYGVLVVTTPGTGSAGTAYTGVAYDADATLLFSEIDPVQNRAVDAAVGTPGFSETRVWSGQAGQCGDPAAPVGVLNTCYPPTVNYDPRYYLINGVSFDRSNPAASAQAILAPGANAVGAGRVLLRLVNAGLRMHVPAVVGRTLTLFAEDGNPLPGVPRAQSDVFMAAGKTFDAGISPAQSGGNYTPATYAIFDRQLSLSTNNQRDGGMLAYLNVAGATSGAGTAAAAATVTANADKYYLVAGTVLSVSDPTKGLIGNDVGVYGVTLLGAPSVGSVALHADGTFTYTPNAGTTSDSFTYCANGTASGTPAVCSSGKFATVTLAQCTGACLGGAPTANEDTYASTVATYLKIGSPGVLQNDTDPSGFALKVGSLAGGTNNPDGSFTATSGAATVTLSPDGSFMASATAPGTYSFTYTAKNAQGTPSGGAALRLTFPTPSHLAVNLIDAKNGKPISDYRWIIEEDRTFWVEPACQINSTDPAVRPASCGPLPVQSFGYNFHTAAMPVVAAGCTGPVSCEQGQTVQGTAVACDVGDGQCRAAAQKVQTTPDQVGLDPTKRYYLSVMPADGVNPILSGAGGSPDGARKFNIATDCGPYDPASPSWVPGGPAGGYADGQFGCGHMMGGAQISPAQVALGANANITIAMQETPAPTAKITVFVYEDDWPLNGENDAGGGIDVLAPQEPGLGGFEIKVYDLAGGLGDPTGQLTYDQFNEPVSNSLAGTIDPNTGLDACPITHHSDGLIGMVPTCPTYESDGKTLSPLAGQAIIDNMYPGLYEVQAYPAADRIGRGEEWLQTNSLDGSKPHEVFIKNEEPAYFQEFGPANFHVMIGFANPKIINDRRHNALGTGICDPVATGGGGLTCTATLTGQVTNAHMSRTPDQRLYSSHTYDSYGFTQCIVGLGTQDQADFALAKCDANGQFIIENVPTGDFKISVFDQWNDILLDGLMLPVKVAAGNNSVEFPVTQWRSNLYTRTYLDTSGDGVSQPTEPGLPLVATNIRYRDGSIGFFNNTDLDGYAGFNEVFPFMNWLVVEADTTRYKVTGVHTVNDTGGPVDGQGGGTSNIANNIANTLETNSLPVNLRVPGAVYCEDADCSARPISGGPYYTRNRSSSGPAAGTALSSGRIDPPGTTTEGWQGLLGQSNYIEFGVKQFVPGENGGIKGHVIYASTRPFDDPALLLQLQWEPGVPHVTVNLYREGTAPDGTQSLQLVDSTATSSWDDFAQGFRSDGAPNMNCPGQDPTSPFFQTLKGSTQYLDPSNPKKALPNDAQFKCYDGWSMLNQVQPAPYDGMYKFPSVTAIDPVSGRPTGTNCTICKTPQGSGLNPDDGNPMLPPGKYVVEVIVPPGYELVKEEDKNILLGDTYIAPVTQQFAGFGNVYIMPDQAAINALYNKNSPLNATQDLGATPRHEGDTGMVESFWPCVGAERIVPDYNSLYPTAGQNAPFAGATRRLCDRKEVTLADQGSVVAKFYVFTNTHVAGHFTGMITNDYASEFDPFAPQFGEKFAPPNLPVALKDYTGREMGRVYSDQWGIFNGLNYSTWSVNPPNPTGYTPQMMIACMNDPGPIPDPAHPGQTIVDPLYNAAYSDFCYEQPFMPGFTTYMDTPVIPVQAFADGYSLPDSEYPDATPAILRVDSNQGIGPWVSAGGAGHTLTITALGDKAVANPQYSGPNASTAPYNQRIITRHYGFGTQGPRSSVTIGGVAASVVSWSDTSIQVTVPNSVPLCALQQRGNGNGGARCGELVITADNGKKSIDAILVTVGGKAPTWVVGPDNTGHTIQNAIDAATPGDLIIIGPGFYHEQVIMWKPVRLQGVGSGAVTINADAHPAGVLDPWRRQITCLFGLTIAGTPNPNNAQYDPSGTYTCPSTQFFRNDRLDFEGFVGWDALSNGNLAQLLQEPSLMGAYEGAGVTVVGRGVRVRNNEQNMWGQPAQGGAGGGAYATGARYLTSSNQDCTVSAGNTMYDYGTSNFNCNPSRIDGFSVINSSEGGGGIFLHGWAHNLEISNNRIFGNQGTFGGGISLGAGEVPPAYINDGTICGPGVTGPTAPLCPPLQGTPANGEIPLGLNVNVHVHHNAVYNNASLGDTLYSGSPSGAGGITVSPGADRYTIDHNWVAGNLAMGDGAGIEHLGFSNRGRIANNWVLFNQSTNPTIPTNGGGIGIIGANNERFLANALECGSLIDLDCPPGIGDGTGAGLVIDSNLIIGNSAESGSGGGLRVQQANGTEIAAFATNPDRWYDVTVTNNIIANNVAGWDGAGVSLEDSLKVRLVNNTIVSNDTTASAGVLFKALAAPTAASPPPGCDPTTDPTQPQNPNCTIPNAPHIPQPAGLVTMVNTPNLVGSFPATVVCPSGFNYGNAQDTLSSRRNGSCRLLSKPYVANDLFWQNRAFHVAYADQNGNEISNDNAPQPGAGLLSQQNLVALFPALNQSTTGECVNQANFPYYWDVGVRGDTSPINHTVSGFTPILGAPSVNPTLFVNNSILTANPSGYVNGSGNQVPTNSPVVGSYCNGSRVPPENGGKGYNAPAGRSETTGLSPVFVFNNITVAATIDEGNNWINLSYGPLSLFSTAAQDLAGSLDGPTLGAYSTPPTATAAVDKGLNSASGVPNIDFFGNPRAHNGANPVDIGAVEVARPAAAAVVSPTSLAFGNWATGTISPVQLVTVTNTGSGALAGGTFTGISAPFARVTSGSFPSGAPNCTATLAVGASCTIKVQFAPTATGSSGGSLTVAYTGAIVAGSPVSLSGTGVANRATTSISALTITLPQCTGNNLGPCTTGTGVVTFTNTAPVSGGAQLTVSGVAASPMLTASYSFITGALAGADNCTGTTLVAGASCTVTVRFTNFGSNRRSPVTRDGTITFTDNGAGSPQSQALVGIAN